MRTPIDEPEIREIRAARTAISRACGNDPWKLVAHMERFRLDTEGSATRSLAPRPKKAPGRAPAARRSA